MTAHDRGSIARAQMANAAPTSPVRVTVNGEPAFGTSPFHTEESIKNRLGEKMPKSRRLFLTAGNDDSADAFGGRERTVDADVNLVHKLSSNLKPMRIKDRTAPLFVSLDVKAVQLVGRWGGPWQPLIDSIDAAGDDEDARQRQLKELCGEFIDCVSGTVSSAEKSRHISYNYQVTSARGGVVRVSGVDDIVRIAVCMFGNNLPKAIDFERIQNMPDSDFPEGHAVVFKLAKWLPGGAQGLTVQTIKKDPKKVCAHTFATFFTPA